MLFLYGGVILHYIFAEVLKYTRTEYGKSIRKLYERGVVEERIRNMRKLVPREDGISNTITTVLKDNYIMELKESEMNN